ncbi:type VI secretion protein, partial [Streptomyces sp. YS-3]
MPESRSRGEERGIPDSLLVGLLAFLLGLTVLVWTATGLAGLFSHGAWPDAVTFTRTPLALRQLVQAPHDLPAAWPDTPAAQLSGYGLFWGLLISELLILLVLFIFALGTWSRWKAVRARAKTMAATQETTAEPAAGRQPSAETPLTRPAQPPAQAGPPPTREAATHAWSTAADVDSGAGTSNATGAGMARTVRTEEGAGIEAVPGVAAAHTPG